MPDPANDRFETVAAATLVTLSQGLADGNWMLVLPAGTWTDRGGRDPFNVGDLTAMQAIVDRTRQHFERQATARARDAKLGWPEPLPRHRRAKRR